MLSINPDSIITTNDLIGWLVLILFQAYHLISNSQQRN